MLELFKEIEWDDYVEVLTYNNPPVYIQLIIFTVLVLAWHVWNVIRKKRPPTRAAQIKNKILFVGFFLLILFQEKYDLRGMLDSIGL